MSRSREGVGTRARHRRGGWSVVDGRIVDRATGEIVAVLPRGGRAARPVSAFEFGPLKHIDRHERHFPVYRRARHGQPRQRLGYFYRGGSSYLPTATLRESIPDLADDWPVDLDLAATRRAITFIGRYHYCDECDHAQPCGCDTCPMCDLRTGSTP